MDVDTIAELLKRSIGLDMASVSKSFIEAAIKTRIAKTQSSNTKFYIQRLKDSPLELAELFEEAVIPETWFFRDAEAIWSMVRDVQAHFLRNKNNTLRILSLPCASGEEPYSLAMALIDAGVAANRFQIEGIDISQRALERAQRTIYGSNSFRGVAMQPFRDRYFDCIDTKWQLHDRIRNLVSFRQGNVLDINFTLERIGYDVIFCRNLLIYFDRATQNKTLKLLLGLLRPEGTIYVGPAEGGLLLEHGLISNSVPLAFGFQRGEQLSIPKNQKDFLSTPAKLIVKANPTGIVKPVLPKIKPVTAYTAKIPSVQKATTGLPLAEVADLANQGRLTEAICEYEVIMQEQGPSAQVFHLLALAQDANGDYLKAEQNYRKALYLDPAYQEALLHLASLMDIQGRPDAARQLRKRADRLKVSSHG